ncbi:MAG: CHAT domain-containing protein [Polyangiaceae bacterium]
MSAARDTGPLEIVLELVRAEQAGDPFGFRFAPQTYLLRNESGGFSSASFPWDSAVLEDLQALARPRPDRVAMQRLGDRLRGFLGGAGYGVHETAIATALAEDRPVHLTLRSAAAEMYALPWELVTLAQSGRHLGEHDACLLRYEWPDSPEADGPEAPPEGGRLVFAWSAAGGAVPAEEHLAALSSAMGEGGLPFDRSKDVVAGMSISRLRAALSAEPVTVLHLLCHGGASEASGDTFGLVLDGERGPEVVDPGTLRQLLAPHAESLRLVVIAACHGGDPGALGNHLGSVAQALHRAGIPAVVASRFPLSTEGSVALTQSLYKGLLTEHLSVEGAFVAARNKVSALAARIDWASLQLYARNAEGGHRPFAIRPYRGLSPFRASDRCFYHGREEDISRLVASLSRSRLVLLMGASGSGKSSLAMAGVAPHVEEGALGGEPFFTRVLRPGIDPCRELAAAIASLPLPKGASSRSISALESEMLHRPDALARQAAERLGGQRPCRVLLVIDQFEEVFAVTDTEEERGMFIDNLLHATARPDSPVTVLLTARADFLGQCLEHRGLAARVRGTTEILLPLPADKLREAIVRPAERVGLRFEGGLVDAILDSLRDATGPTVPSARAAVLQSFSESAPERPILTGSLPLLEFALEELWLRRKGNLIGWDAWRQLGGVREAIARRADQLFASHSAEEREILRRVFARLVRIGDGTANTRRRVPRTELLALAPGKVEHLLDRWLEARLLVADETYVTIAHEALLRQWRVVHRWINDNREALRLLHNLRAAAATWDAEGRSPDELWRGGRLRRVIEVVSSHSLPLSRVEQDFVDAADAGERASTEVASAAQRRELEAARELALSRKKAATRLWIGMGALFAGSVGTMIAQGVYSHSEIEQCETARAQMRAELSPPASQAPMATASAATGEVDPGSAGLRAGTWSGSNRPPDAGAPDSGAADPTGKPVIRLPPSVSAPPPAPTPPIILTPKP